MQKPPRGMTYNWVEREFRNIEAAQNFLDVCQNQGLELVGLDVQIGVTSTIVKWINSEEPYILIDNLPEGHPLLNQPKGGGRSP